ncbi:MAG: phosphatidylglycerophosphatase A [Myxococcales bacterium]|nr:phosphatidylglycerophosphatase A [Myxococcales bacterium]
MPGTWGTLPAVALYWAMSGWSAWAYAVMLAALVPFGTWISDRALTILGGEHDNQKIVIDEIAGYLLTVAFLPFTWTAALVGFAWFRIFDMTKPGFIGAVDRDVKGGFGVMADDLAAGAVALVATRLTLWALAGLG